MALIAIGPKELPGVLRNVGHWMGKIRRLAAEFQSQFQEAMREAEMADLKEHADDLNNAARLLTEQPEGANERAHVSSNEAASPVTSASEYPTAALHAEGGPDEPATQSQITHV